MERFLMLIPFLAKLSDGNALRSSCGWALRGLAFAGAFAALYLSVALWLSGAAEPYLFAVALAQIVLLAAAYALLNVLWARAAQAFADAGGGRGPFSRLFALLLRAAGDVSAVLFATCGLCALLFLWFGDLMLAATAARNFVPLSAVLAGEGFAGGLLSLATGLALGFIAYFALNFLAELAEGARASVVPEGADDDGAIPKADDDEDAS